MNGIPTISDPRLSGRALATPRQVAEALGVSESSVKRWADEGRIEAVRTVGRHRRIPVEEVCRFVRETGLRLVHPEAVGIAPGPAPAVLGEPPSDRLYRAFMQERAEDARQVILTQYLEGKSAARVIDEVVTPALARVGELWQHDDDGIRLEHLAMDSTLQAIRRIQSMIAPPAEGAPLAIGGAPDADVYTLPSLGASLTLAEAGFQTLNFGSCVPLKVLASAAARRQPLVVWLAMSATPEDEVATEEAIRQMAAAADEWGGLIALGGRQAPEGLRENPPSNLRMLSGMLDLEAFAGEAVARWAGRPGGGQPDVEGSPDA